MTCRRASLRLLLLAALGLAAVFVLPAQGRAARLQARPVAGGVVVRLVGARAHAVRYTLGRRTIARARHAPFNVVLYGYTLAGRGVHGRKIRVVARNGRNGRRLGVVRLVAGKQLRPDRKLRPTVQLTDVPPATTTSTSASVSFVTTNATAITCSLDGSTFSACSSPASVSGLALGDHALTVLATSGAGAASAVASWKVVAPPPPPSGGVTPAPVAPPTSYALPAGATRVSTSAQLAQALAGPRADIVVADGIYDNSGPFVDAGGHRVFAEHLGGAVFRAGFVMGGNWGPGHGVLQGLAFDVRDPAKVLSGSIVHVWGTGAGTQILDTTFEGNNVISSGILARQVEGLVVRRVVARQFVDWGVIVEPNDASFTPVTPPLLEDVDASDVTWATPRASNGRAEACLWLGVKAVVRRVKTRNCAWEGIWVGTGTRDSLFEDLDVNDSGIGVYVEHFATQTTFRRLHAGPNVDRGLTCEWADPAWGSKPACSNDIVEQSYFDTRVIGVYLDQGTIGTTVRSSTFVHQSCGAIGNYLGVGNLWDTTGNDYSGIAAGAVPIFTGHLYAC
jgi:hypothetical protein